MRTLKTSTSICLVFALLVAAEVSCSRNPETPPPASVNLPSATSSSAPVKSGEALSPPDLTYNEQGLSKATVVINTSRGVIKFKFYPKDAPRTVERIAELIRQKPKGFYDGLTFHRVVPGFVVQGGDPLGTGIGGSGHKLLPEFNRRPHVEGTVAMARAAAPDSADSQFYISLGTLPSLDGKYTVFGQVTEGMDVVKKIQVGDKMDAVRVE